MSATTLLVLGVVKIFQPAHGYLVRRELLSWGVENWASVNPGSIYNALRAGVRAGHLVEEATEQGGGGPSRTTYRLTGDGETAFGGLLRAYLWKPDVLHPERLLSAMCFMSFLTRAEVLAACDGQAERLLVSLAELRQRSGFIMRERTAPAETVEQFLLGELQLQAQRDWCLGFAERVSGGAYHFRDDPGPHRPGSDGRWPAEHFGIQG